ncbi:flagellar basal-body MS-ring/collar protein FliF [Candidatus Latescibacterota bacterium]
MFELIENLIVRIREVWVSMTLNQKVITGGMLVALLFSALYITTLSDRIQNYAVLFAQLDAQSASKTIAHLEQENIPYRLTQNGTAIEVPADQADRLKIELIAEGLPESGVVGYEILDTTNFGMSDYLQKINYRRAMEGELRKTLREFNEVEDAKVGLVIPEPALFAETEQPPTASVLLKLRRGRSISPQSVVAIQNLIASAAVEGLDPANVTIVDTGGNLLSKPRVDELALQSGTMMELKFSYERVLANKVKNMLDGAFGSGIALVNINADLDFDRIERETISYDQDNSAIVAQEREEVTNPATEGGASELEITNYDTGSIVERLVKSPGSTVNRLTVSVLLDDRDSTWVDDDGTTQMANIPWSAEQLNSIRSISETAIGYNAARGDLLVVENIEFGAREIPEIGEAPLRAAVLESVKVITMGVIVLAALGVFFVIVRNIVRTLDPTKLKVKADAEYEKFKPEIETEEEVISERGDLIKKILSQTTKDTDIAAKTIRSIYKSDE